MQIITRNELRGAEVFATTLSQALLQRNHRVCIPAIYHTDTPAFAIDGAEHVELGGKRKGKLEWRALMNLRRCIKSYRPEIIQANGFHALKYSVLAKKLSRNQCPIVYRNISLAGDWVRGKIRQTWGRWLFNNVDHVTSVSRQCASNLCQTYSFPTDRTDVIRRGINVPETVDTAAARNNLSQALGNDGSGHILMHTGGFTEEKNQAGLLQVFRTLLDRRDDVCLAFCGDGPLRADVQSMASKLDLGGTVHFLGNRADAAELVGGADLFVLTSHVEGIPGVVLEAAVRGIPAVCMNVGGLGEAVIDGKTGLLVPDGNETNMSDAIDRLLNDDQLRSSMGHAAHEYVSTHFALGRAVDEFEQLYEKLVGAKSRELGVGEFQSVKLKTED